jgi:hypothetical protein
MFFSLSCCCHRNVPAAREVSADQWRPVAQTSQRTAADARLFCGNKPAAAAAAAAGTVNFRYRLINYFPLYSIKH